MTNGEALREGSWTKKLPAAKELGGEATDDRFARLSTTLQFLLAAIEAGAKVGAVDSIEILLAIQERLADCRRQLEPKKKELIKVTNFTAPTDSPISGTSAHEWAIEFLESILMDARVECGLPPEAVADTSFRLNTEILTKANRIRLSGFEAAGLRCAGILDAIEQESTRVLAQTEQSRSQLTGGTWFLDPPPVGWVTEPAMIGTLKEICVVFKEADVRPCDRRTVKARNGQRFWIRELGRTEYHVYCKQLKDHSLLASKVQRQQTTSNDIQ